MVSPYALFLRFLYPQPPEGPQDVPKAPPSVPRVPPNGNPMTPDAFTASLERSAAQHPPSKARRIAALLPQIEVAMAQGSPRAHICLLYTSDAADERSSVDLGGRRIIKKK